MEIRRTKNLATYIVFPIMKNDGTLISGAAGLDSEIDTFADGSAPDGFTDCTNEATEIGSTGQYYLSLTQSEMNADYIIIQVKSSTSGAVTQTILINTTLQRSNVVQISDAATAADNCELMFDGTGYAGGTTKLGVDAVAISGDATAADNLEAAHDGTGYAGGTIKQKVDLETIKTQAVTCAAGVTVLASVGTAATSTAQTGDAYARLGAPAGASVSADVAAVKTVADAVKVVTDNIAGMYETDGAVKRYTANALELAPTGGSAPTVEQIRAEIDSNSTQLAAIKAKTDNLPTQPKKNVALSNFPIFMVLTSDHVTPATGKTLTVTISKDGGAFGASSNSATEIGSGWYKLDLTQAEMNADQIIIVATATACDAAEITILTSA